MTEKDKKKKVLIGAEDEGRFGRIGDIRKCWCPFPFRPLVVKQLIREYFYVFSFVCPDLGIILSLILPYCNLEMMKLFLDYVSNVLNDYFIIIQVDRAVWHTSSNLCIPDNIRLIPQPRGSPELNPVEHIWEEIREKDLCNLSFNNLESIKEVVSDSLNKMSKNNEMIKSMTNFPHLKLDV